LYTYLRRSVVAFGSVPVDLRLDVRDERVLAALHADEAAK